MSYDEALRWLAAIGGTHGVVREDTREVVVVQVASASKGEVCARRTLDTTLSQEQAHRRALALACDELRRALS
jgi:hypothetical protein